MNVIICSGWFIALASRVCFSREKVWVIAL